MELEARVSPEFELTLDNTPVLHAVNTLSFFQMKGLYFFTCNDSGSEI